MRTLQTEELGRVAGGVTYTARHDQGLAGQHKGWCKAPGHPEGQGQGAALGHRNHDHCLPDDGGNSGPV